MIARLPLPLDVAAHRWALVGTEGSAGEYGIDRRAYVGSGDCAVISRTALVKLAAVDQSVRSVEEKEVWSARGMKVSRDLLCRVMKIWKTPAAGVRHLDHLGWSVIGMRDGIVRANADDSNATTCIVVGESREFFLHMDHKRAVIADEHDDKWRRSKVIA